MGGQLSQPSKLQDSNIITGLSYLEDGQFSKIYKVDNIFFPMDIYVQVLIIFITRVIWCRQMSL